MNVTTRTFWELLILFTHAIGAFAQTATLTSPSRNGDEFRFDLQGDAYRRYVIQGSSNLVDWVWLTTSVSTGPVHPLSFSASNGFSFFRTGLYSRTNSLGKAIQLTELFDSKGSYFLADSFNSTNISFSTNGRYDPSKRSDAAELSFDQGLTNSLETAGFITVFGSIAIGPQAPLQLGPNDSIGSLAWIYGANSGVQAGKLSTDINPHFPEIKVPFTSAPVPPIGENAKILQHGDYALNELTGKTLVVGNARLYVSRSIALSDDDYIHIQTNASLRLYVGATNAFIGGMGIINADSKATNFIYFGLASNTNLTLAANGSFAGIIYAPQAHATFGEGTIPLDLMGAIVARSMDLNGLFRFHYDEALREIPFPE